MLQARGRRAIKCTGLTAFFVAVAIDAAAVVLLREAPALVEELKDEPLVDPPLWTPAALLAGLPDLSHDTVDVLVLFVVRVLVLLFLGWLAVKVGTPDLSKLTVAPASDAAAPLLIAPPTPPPARSTCHATAPPPPPPRRRRRCVRRRRSSRST